MRTSASALAGAAIGCDRYNPAAVIIPRKTLDNFVSTYIPIVEELALNKQELSSFLYSQMASEAEEVSLDYSRDEGEKVKYEGTRLASEDILGDADDDGRVNIWDLLKILRDIRAGAYSPASDIDGNGFVNIFDLLDLLKIMQGTYGKTLFKGSLTDLFSNEPITEADIEILDAYGVPVSTQKARNGAYNVSLASSADYFKLKFSAGNYFAHVSSALCADKSKTMNLGLVPSSFNMDLFDEVVRSGNNQPDATTRWMDVPKFYIVNGPISGFEGFETPKSGYIDELVNIINNDLKTFTNGFIANPLIKIGNNPLGEGAAEFAMDYGVRSNPGWVTITYTLDPNMGFTAERRAIPNKDYSVNRAGIRIKNNNFIEPQTHRTVAIHELTAIMGDIKNTNKTLSVLNYPYGDIFTNPENYSEFDLQLGKFLYSRPARNRTKDTNP